MVQYNEKWECPDHDNVTFRSLGTLLSRPYPRLGCGFGYPRIVMNRRNL